MADAKRILRGIARALAYGQLLLVGLFAVDLIVAERTRPTFLLLYAPRFPIVATGLVACALAAWLRSRWLVAVQAAALLIAAFPICGLSISLPRSASKEARATVKMRTWNVFFGKLGYDELAKSIVDADADVQLLQASREHVGEACARRGLTVRHDGEFGIASKFPIRRVELPPTFDDGKVRMFVRYEIDTPGGPLTIVSVHPFSPRHAIEDGDAAKTAADVELRDRQIGAAVESAKSAGMPFVIVGDTNLPTGSAIARRRFSGLHDAFDDVGNGFGFSFTAKRPWMRIDRFLAGRGVRFVSIRTEARGPSDHRAVAATLELVGDGG